jgi:hypothetical protein
MRHSCKFAHAPLISRVLIVAMFIGGLPMLMGVTITSDSKPAFVLDLCHPVGGASFNATPNEAPLIPTHTAFQLPRASGAVTELAAPLFPRVSKAPDPPPPKIGA